MQLAVAEDTSGRWTFDEARQQHFSSIEASALRFGFSDSAFWLKVVVKVNPNPNDIQSSRYVFENCYTQLDYIDYFRPNGRLIDSAPAWEQVKTGDMRTFSTRDVAHPCFVFDLPTSDSQLVYFRIQSSGVVNFPVELLDRNNFLQQNQSRSIAYASYFSFVLAMVIYNLFLFSVIRESGYFYYVAYLGSVALYLATSTGYASMLLWPNSPNLANIAPLCFAIFAASAGMMFLRNISNIAAYSKKIHQSILIVSLIGLLTIICILFNMRWAIYFFGIHLLIGLSLASLAIIISSYRKWLPSYFLLAGAALMVPASIISLQRVLGNFEETWLSTNILFITTALESLILAFALAYRFRILSQKVDQQRLQAVAAQSQFSRSLLNAADNERRAIARELHDSFGQSLLAIKNLISRLYADDNQHQAVNQLKSLISDTRNMARSMHPQQIETLGFSTALETMLVDTFKATTIKLKLELDDVAGRLDKESELHLYRIAQESANNVVKHASATEVVAYLEISDDLLTMKVCDNGYGFQPGTAKGLGILNMRERAAIIGADFKIRNRLPHGTDIIITVTV